MKRSILGLTIVAAMVLPVGMIAPAWASEPTPGDSCSSYPENAIMRSGGPELDGAFYFLRCESDLWVDVTESTPAEPTTCEGTVVGGYCWYYTANGENCDNVCATRGGYNDATRTYAGDTGSLSACGAVFSYISARPDYIGPPEDVAVEDLVPVIESGGGCFAVIADVGGGETISMIFRLVDAPTTSTAHTYTIFSGPGMETAASRACACGT